MTRKQIILIVTGFTIIVVASYVLVSDFTLAPQPPTETPVIITCEKQGLITDPVDNTKCLATLATTTATTTPPVPTPTPQPISSGKFDALLSFTTKQSLTISDGLKVTLTSIGDSRCKANVQCIWVGELAPEFNVTSGLFGKEVATISLGTVRSNSITVDAYTFTLLKATETTATISITKKSVPTAKGTVQGKVTIGPICPVERLDEPCVIPPETYTSRNVIVYGPTDSVKISETPLRSNGTYTLSLAPGNYWLQIAPAGIGPGEKKLITIKANETTALDFDIDSGIR